MKKLKFLSLLCVMAMLVSCFAVFPAVAAENEEYYTTGMPLTLLEGGAEKTYLIDNENFLTFWKDVAHKQVYANFRLLEDIEVNQGNASEWSDPTVRATLKSVWETPIVGTGRMFGVFDGDGHYIKGVCMVAANKDHYTGLFGMLKASGEYVGTVKNLKLLNSYFETAEEGVIGTYTGSIAAGVVYGVIENCYSDAIINYKGSSSNVTASVGGITGYADGTINKCIFAGKILNTAGPAGGILGMAQNNAAKLYVSNCVNMGTINSNTSIVGALVGHSNPGLNISNCVNLSNKITANYEGGASADIIGVLGGGNNATTAGINVTNCVLVDGFRTSGKHTIASRNDLELENGVVEKTLSGLLDSNTKVFADWTYKNGYVPNPTSFDLEALNILNLVDAKLLGLETNGEIHSIRISANNPGLRFETHVDADMISALKAEGAEIKMITYITAAKYLQDSDFEFTYAWLNANKKVLAPEATDYLRTDAVDGYTAFAGSVSNIYDLTMEYIARGCLEITMNGETVLVYADWCEAESACVSRIAYLASVDVSLTQTEYFANLITNETGDEVYSPYTQAQYDSILLLIEEVNPVIPNPANGLALETTELNELEFSTQALVEEPLQDIHSISVQGGCVDGEGYSYNFYIKSATHGQAWLVKTNITTKEVVMIKELTETQMVGDRVETIYGHCGNATYNTKTNEIAVLGNSNKVHIIDPDTLELKKSYSLPSGKSISSIAYNEINNEYYGLKYEIDASNYTTVYCFDAYFTTCVETLIEYCPTQGYYAQGAWTDGVYFYVTEYKEKNSITPMLNNFQVYNIRTGEQVACVNMNIAYETENISFYNGDFYVTCNNDSWTGSKIFKVTVSSSIDESDILGNNPHKSDIEQW